MGSTAWRFANPQWLGLSLAVVLTAFGAMGEPLPEKVLGEPAGDAGEVTENRAPESATRPSGDSGIADAGRLTHVLGGSDDAPDSSAGGSNLLTGVGDAGADALTVRGEQGRGSDAGAAEPRETLAQNPVAAPPLQLDAPPGETPEVAIPVPVRERPELVIKTLLGLVMLLALAYLGGHRRVQDLEEKLGISQLITSGLPFVALGLFASQPAVGILSDKLIADLGPILRLGLGWIGFIVGFRFNAQRLALLSEGRASVIAQRVALAFLAIVGGASLVLLIHSKRDAAEPTFIRDALILGTAGIVTARSTARLLERAGGAGSAVLVSTIGLVEELAAMMGLLVVAAYFRPGSSEANWQLPGTAWLLLTLGLGVVIGMVVYAVMLLRTRGSAEYMVLALGSISFAAGMAGNLQLSPVVVCCVAGALLANFPGDYKERLERTLLKLERPIYLLFLIVVGALWRVDDFSGWILMLAFVGARLLGKWLGVNMRWQAGGELDPHQRKALVFAPMGALAIAIVVNAGIFYPGESISTIFTAVLGGAILTEIVVQWGLRKDPVLGGSGVVRDNLSNLPEGRS